MADEVLTLRDDAGRAHRVGVGADGAVTINGTEVRIREAPDGSLHATGQRNVVVWAAMSGDTRWVFVDGHVFTFDVDRPASGRARSVRDHGPLTAPMPATVRRIAVAPGDAVRRGEILIILEAMKMELPVRANADGRVAAVHCREGEMVPAGQELAEVEEDEVG